VQVDPVDVNRSGWDNQVFVGADGQTALRLGLRQITGFRADWAEAIAAHRPYASLEEMTRKAGLPPRAVRLLADADACRSLARDRREALWDARRMPADALPLFAAADARELGEEADMALPDMALQEHVVADYQTLRLSLKAHPMALLRPVFQAEKTLSCANLATAPAGKRVSVAGLVLVRQRPGNGKAIFITLEDETGVANIILWARTFEAQRRAVMSARLMQVQGEVQRSAEGIVHLLAHRIIEPFGHKVGIGIQHFIVIDCLVI
jgi:error-prone DNA polymerase